MSRAKSAGKRIASRAARSDTLQLLIHHFVGSVIRWLRIAERWVGAGPARDRQPRPEASTVMTGRGRNDEIGDSPAAPGTRHGPANLTQPLPADNRAAEIDPVSPPRARKRLVPTVGAAAAVIAVAAIALATTLKDGAAETPAQAMAAASHATAGLRSFSATMTEQFGGGGAERAVFEEQRSPFLMSMSMIVQFPGHALPISVIMTKTTMYMKLGTVPGLPRQLVGKWIKISLSLGLNPLAAFTQGSGGYNPISEVQMLGAGAQVRDVGTQVVGGVQTTKYTGSFAMSGALKRLPATARSQLSSIANEVSGQIHFTVWIDSQHRVRQVVETENAANIPVLMTMTLSGFNQPVTVTVPPASQVYSPPTGGLSSLAS
jgi:hypothetical protein